MALIRDVTTATQRSSNAPSGVRRARLHQDLRNALLNHVAEVKRFRFRTIWQVLRLWTRRRKDRVILRSLSPRDIHDFCLSQTDADTEMNKPFWRA